MAGQGQLPVGRLEGDRDHRRRRHTCAGAPTPWQSLGDGQRSLGGVCCGLTNSRPCADLRPRRRPSPREPRQVPRTGERPLVPSTRVEELSRRARCASRAHISRAHSPRAQVKTVLTVELLILIYYFFLIRLASLATHGMAIFVAMIIMPSIVFFVLAIAALLATRELYGQSAIAANRRGSYRPPLCDGLQLDGPRSCLEGYSDTLTHARTGAAAVSASSSCL